MEKTWEKQFKKDLPFFSTATMDFFNIDEQDIESIFLSELNNPETYTSMANVNTFIWERKDTRYFIGNISTLIKNINTCMEDNKREIKIQDIVAIKRMTTGKKEFKPLDNAMEQIIKNLLTSMDISCRQIENCNVIQFTRVKTKFTNIHALFEAWWYDKTVEDVFSSKDKAQIESLKTLKVDNIERSFDLAPNEYTLGRFGNSKPAQPINKIPVFSSTHPFIESKDHAILKVDNDNQTVTIHNVKQHNGTNILRNNNVIKVRGANPNRLFINDVICIGHLISNYIDDDKMIENDAKYKLNIPKPTTIILNGFIECSVDDAISLMDSIVLGEILVDYNRCIYEKKHFKNPNSQGGGPAYITIAGRRRKIHIEKGKQYVNYKSELILVTKLKKLIK